MDKSYVVVFPSAFTTGRVELLERNIKSILETKREPYNSIILDDSIIVVDAEDPVLASSAVGLLYGTKMVAIATRVENNFDGVVSEIAKTGRRLLLKGDRFHVRVEGMARGFLPKDMEVAATSAIITATSGMGVSPSTATNHGKLLYTFLTKSNAYVCIFTDSGLGGIPYGTHRGAVLCLIYDSISAISCLETIKQGFEVRIAVCYRNERDLRRLVRILCRIIPRTVSGMAEVVFYEAGEYRKGGLAYMYAAARLAGRMAAKSGIRRITLSLTPVAFPAKVIDELLSEMHKLGLTAYMPLGALEDEIYRDAAEIGIEGSAIEKELAAIHDDDHTKGDFGPPRRISVTTGPNSIHEILDRLKTEECT